VIDGTHMSDSTQVSRGLYHSNTRREQRATRRDISSLTVDRYGDICQDETLPGTRGLASSPRGPAPNTYIHTYYAVISCMRMGPRLGT